MNSVFAPGLDERVGNLWSASLPLPLPLPTSFADPREVLQDWRRISRELQYNASLRMTVRSKVPLEPPSPADSE